MSEEAPVPGSDEYNQQMADRFRNPPMPDDPQEDVPPLPAIPEGGQDKYYNADTGAYDWESHAKELQFNLNGRKNPEPEAEQPELQQPQIQQNENQVSDIISAAGLNQDELTQRVEQDGDLSQDDYAALQKVGIPESLARNYVENMMYRQQGERQTAYDYAGGEENWNQMSQWATDNMSQDEVSNLNTMLHGPDWRLAMDAIKARMGPRLSDSEPSLVSGEPNLGGTFGYRSKDEMKADMASPEYRTNAQFRQQVMQKMQSATWDLDPDYV